MSEGRRVKRWAPKTFSGCSTCKRRRIKCDEGKPTCQRCARSGLQCEGYAPPTARMFEPKNAERASSQDRALTIRQSPSTTRSTSTFSTPEETRSFEFFMRKTADLISIYSQRHFWTTIIPQATHQHTAVKHSVLALSILHESLTQTDGLNEEDNSRLFKHYNTAIRALTQNQPTTDVVLITCILFWTVENFNGAGQPPFDHMVAAENILREFKAKDKCTESPYYDLVTTYIEPIIVDAVQHSRATGDLTSSGEGGDSKELESQLDQILPSRLPTKFTDLEAAHQHLRACLRALLQALHTTDDKSVEPLIERLDLHLRRWIYLLQSVTTDGTACNRRLLVAHHINAMALLLELKKSLELEVDDADDAKDQYNWNVTEIEELIANYPLVPHSRKSHELGVIPPLFTAAVRCTSLEVRARALAVLKELNRDEGCWTDAMAVRVAQGIVISQAEGKIGLDLSKTSIYKTTRGLNLCGTTPAFDLLLVGSDEELPQIDMAALNTVVHNYGYQLDLNLRLPPPPEGAG